MQKVMDSPVGKLYIVASDKGLEGIYWSAKDCHVFSEKGGKAAGIISETEKQLTEYFAGKRTTFDLPLDFSGTPFQKRVWQKLQQIPYGETRSYKDIAVELNDANACRAVGTANGKNPVSIVIPCHRVVNTGGKLGGYAGGLDTKEKLLELEQIGHLS